MLETGSGARSAPEADECFDGEFFGAGGIAHDSGNDARDAVESGAEEESMSRVVAGEVAASRAMSLGAFTFI
jgi:hypothetical protein